MKILLGLPTKNEVEEALVKKPEKAPFTIESMHEVFYEFDDIVEDELDALKLSSEDRKNLREKRIKEFVERQKNNLEVYYHIFETEHGSIYFVTQDGGCFRIYTDKFGKLKMGPTTENVFWIDDATSTMLLQMANAETLQEGVKDIPIETHLFALGLHPFEVITYRYHRNFRIDSYTEDGKSFIRFIDSPDNEPGDFAFASGFHIGDRISRIYK